MNEDKLLKRIVIDPKVMVGKPVIRGTRLTVQHILGLLALDTTMDDIIQEYEGLTREDIWRAFSSLERRWKTLRLSR